MRREIFVQRMVLSCLSAKANGNEIDSFEFKLQLAFLKQEAS
jgi:hypothetical protein